MDYEKVRRYLNMLETVELILRGEELVGIWVGPHRIGYPDFSIKGDTVHCRVNAAFTFSVKLPAEWIEYAEKLRDWLLSEIKREIGS